jgi:hypothetical protein
MLEKVYVLEWNGLIRLWIEIRAELLYHVYTVINLREIPE